MNAVGLTRCPYRGLIPFSEEDTGMFFGRDAETRIVGANLIAARLTLLYGDSGVGKSSILHAGVVPHVRQTANASLRRLGRPRFHVVVVDRWQDDPMAGICQRMMETLSGALKDRQPPSFRPSRFTEYLTEWTNVVGCSILFVFDQFEEYLRYHEREAGEAMFAEEFPRAVMQPDLKVNFLLAVREDEYARLDRFKSKLPGLYRNYLRLRYLGPDAARQAIVRPLEVARAQNPNPTGPTDIEPELVDAILQDVQDGRVVLGDAGVGAARGVADDVRIQTPYLQLVLTRVWNIEAAAGSDIMRLATYRDLGGADRIVRTHLAGVLSEFLPAEQAAAAAIFRHLVTPSGAKVAHSLTDLSDYARCPSADLRPVLDRLCGTMRILRPVAPSRQQLDAPRFEIFTDSLAKPILDWGNRFRRAQERAEAEAKLAKERQRKLVFLRLSAGLMAAFIVAVTLGVVAWRNWRAALVREAITQAADLIETDPEASVRTMLEAAKLTWLQPLAIKRQTEQSLRKALLASHRRQAPGPEPAGLIRTNAWEWTSPDDALTFRRLSESKGILEMRRSSQSAASAGTWERFDPKLNEVVNSVAFGPRNAQIAVCGPQAVSIWQTADLVSGLPRFVLTQTNSHFRAAAFSPDESQLATVGDDAVIRLWDLANGSLFKSVPEDVPGVNDVAFSPDGRFLATARNDGTAAVWQVADGRQVAVLRGHGSAVTRVKFSEDGQFVWTADASAQVQVWASRTGQIIAAIPPPHRLVAAAPTTAGLMLAGTLSNGGRVWRQSGNTSLVEFVAVDYAVTRAAFSADGRYVALTGRRPSVQVWEIVKPTPPPVTLTTSNQLIALGFAPDPFLLATVDRNGQALVWHWQAGTHGPAFWGPKAEDGHVLFDHAGSRLVTASGNQPQVFPVIGQAPSDSIVTNALIRGPMHGDSVTYLSLAGDASSVLSVDNSGTAKVWSLTDGRTRWSAELSTSENALLSGGFSPDDRFLVTGGLEGVAYWWDLDQASLPPLAVLPGHRIADPSEVVATWFASDGRTAFSAGSDGTIRRHKLEELSSLTGLISLAERRLGISR